MDWSDCPLVESDPFKLGGVPILKGTRMQADSIVENYEGGSPVEEISEDFRVPEDTIRLVLAFAHEKPGAPYLAVSSPDVGSLTT